MAPARPAGRFRCSPVPYELWGPGPPLGVGCCAAGSRARGGCSRVSEPRAPCSRPRLPRPLCCCGEPALAPEPRPARAEVPGARASPGARTDCVPSTSSGGVAAAQHPATHPCPGSVGSEPRRAAPAAPPGAVGPSGSAPATPRDGVGRGEARLGWAALSASRCPRRRGVRKGSQGCGCSLPSGRGWGWGWGSAGGCLPGATAC